MTDTTSDEKQETPIFEKRMRQVFRGSARVLLGTSLRCLSEHAAAPVVKLKIVRTTQKAPSSVIATPGEDKQGAFLVWQERLRPQLAGLSPYGLCTALFEAKTWLPLRPEKDFMDAWLEASKPVMADLSISVWDTAHELGARPDEDVLRLLVLAAKDVLLQRSDWSSLKLALVIKRLGGTVESIRGLMQTAEEAAMAQWRSGNAKTLFFRAPEFFNGIGYVPSCEFVQLWVANILKALPRLDEKHILRLLDAAVRMPTDRESLLLPLLEQLGAKKIHFELGDDRFVVGLLFQLGESEFEPPAHWIKDVCADLSRRLLEVDKREEKMLPALAGIAVPARDKEAVTSFAQKWSALTIEKMGKWSRGSLVEALGAMFQLGLSPAVIGEQWFRAWLGAASGGDEVVAGCNVRDLLLACRHAAVKLIDMPLQLHVNMVTAKKAAILMRLLRTLHALCLNDDRVIRMWLGQAKEVGGFRSHQVKRAALYLRNLGAEEAARKWERHNAK